MNEKKQDDAGRKPKHGFFKVVKWVILASAGIALLIFFGTPLLLSSSGGTRFLLSKINTSVDGQVKMDDLSISWFKGVKLTNLSYADQVGNTSVSVKRVETHPRYFSLLGGKVELGKTVIDSPQIHLKVNQNETTPSAPSTSEPATDIEISSESKSLTAQTAGAPPVFPVHEIDLELINGNAMVELVGDAPQKLALTNIASKVKFDQGSRSGAIDVSMNLDESSVSAKGQVKTDKGGWTIEDGDFEVQISKLQIGSLKPLFALTGQEMDVDGELNAEMTVSVDNNKLKQLKADAAITDLTQGTGPQRVRFFQPVTVDAMITTTDETIQIEMLKVQSQFCDVDCSGTPESLSFNVNADLAQTQQLANQFVDTGDLSMAGALTVKGSLAMTDVKSALTGSGSIKQLQIRKENLTTPATDVQVNFDGFIDKVKEQLRIASANLTATPGTVKVSNLVLPMSEDAEKTLSMDAHAALDLGQTWPFAKVFMDDPKINNVTGQVDAAFNVSTKGSQIRLLTENSQVSNLRLDIPDNKPFVQDKVLLNADILLDSEKKTYDIPKFELLGAKGETLIKVKKGNVQKQVSKSRTEVTGDFEAEYDLQAVSAMASPFLPEGLSLAGKRNDTFTFNSVYPTDNPEQMVAHLNGSGAVGFEQLEYMGLNVGPTDLKMNITGGVMDFNISETTVNEGKLRFAATVDLKEESRMLRLKNPTYVLENVHVTEEMTKKMISRLNPLFVGQSNISGFVNLNCNDLQIPFSTEDRKSLFVDATVSIDNAQIQPKGIIAILLRSNNQQPIPLQLLPTQFLVQNEVVSYSDMEFHLADYPTGFSGTITLDGDVDMLVALPWRIDDDGLDFKPVHVGEDLSKRLNIPCRASESEFAKCIRYEELIKSAAGDVIQNQIIRGIQEILK